MMLSLTCRDGSELKHRWDSCLQLTSERLRRADGGRGEAGSDGKERLEPGAAIDSDLLRILSGLRLAEQLGLKEDEAKIRHGLGLSLWAGGNLEEAQHQV